MFSVTSRWPHEGSIKVEWNLGKRCNYDCSYCPNSIHDNTSPHIDLDTAKKAINTLTSLGKPIRLSFTGGEPCVHPKFDEIVKYARFKGVTWISVTTNGTRPPEFYTSLPVNQYVFSLHLEYDWQRVFNTINTVNKTADVKNSVIAQIMCHHDHFNSAMTLFARCLTEHIPATLRRIRWTEGNHDLFDDMRYHPDYLNWIKSHEATVQGNCVIDGEQIIHANDVIKLHLNKYKDWTCNAGLESLMINWDGDVHRATCRVGGRLGNIYTNTLVVPSEPVICDRNYCTCASDIPLTKFNL